jgi:hypothetical protein
MYVLVVLIIYLFLVVVSRYCVMDPVRPVLPHCTGKRYPQIFNWWQLGEMEEEFGYRNGVTQQIGGSVEI